jgi:predicted nucleic acid-binding protein
LIGLERVERLDILPQVFDTVFAPPAVVKEVRTSLDWLIIQAVANPSVTIALRTQMGMKVIGTVGMLLRAKRQGVIAEVKPILLKLTEANFRISQGIIREALRLSGEN